MKYFKFLALISAALLVVLAVCAAGGYFYISNADHKKLLVNAAAKKGYKLDVASVKLDVYPTLRADISQVKLLPFVGERNVVEVEAVKFEAPLLGFILSKNIDLIEVENPKIYLHRQRDKRANWEKPRKSRHSKSNADLSLLSGIGKIKIDGGELSYINEVSGQQVFVRDYLTQLDDKGKGKKRQTLHMVVNGVVIDSDMRFKVGSGSSIPVNGSVSLGDNTLSLEGTVIDANRKTPGFTGQLGLIAETLVPTLAKIGLLKQTEGLPTWPINLQAKAELSSDKAVLSNAVLKLSDTTILNADVAFNRSRKGNSFKATVSSEDLNLNALGLCGKPKKKSASKKKPTPWSSEVTDFKTIRTLSFEVDAKLNNVQCGKKTFPELEAFVANQKGLVKIHNVSVGFGEQDRALLSGQMDARKKIVKGNMSLSLNHVPLNQLAAVNSLELPLDGEGKFTFSGSSTQEMASSLGGTLKVKAEEGRISGFSAANLVSSIGSLFGGKSSGDGSYDVALFEAGYTIEKGVARTDIFQLDATELKAIGEGKVDVGRWLINYKVTPQIGDSVSIPLLIKGSLNKPNIAPDLTSPQAIGMGVGTAVGGPVGAAAGAFIGNLLGDVEQAEERKKNESTPLDFLNNSEDLEKNVRQFLGR